MKINIINYSNNKNGCQNYIIYMINILNFLFNKFILINNNIISHYKNLILIIMYNMIIYLNK